MLNIHVGITDHYDPEVQAMLMAMYSRNYDSILNRLPDDEESTQKHKEKLGKFYVGYNHKSVGQLGVISIWLEGISQLAAKAVEDHPLFNGQESSTRYIDYSNQPMYSSNSGINIWQEKWRQFYIKLLPKVISNIEKEFPFNEQETTKRVYDNTVKARAFDICRGFLPAGSTTNVGFIGTFDTLNDHFGKMLYHPCQEMRDIATSVLTKMKNKYPYGTKNIETLYEEFKYVENKSEFFYNIEQPQHIKTEIKILRYDDFDYIPHEYNRITRNDKFPRHVESNWTFKLNGAIDFGSYRDLHRHRNGNISMHLLTPIHGFDSFYSSNVPEECMDEFNELQREFVDWYHDCSLHSDKSELQYAVPMGYTVPVSYSCGLNQAMYIMELRSGKTVHNSLRRLIHEWVKLFEKETNLKLFANMEEDNFTLKRGTQTFLNNN